ncbi:MAG: hypothetical protein IPI77_23785 [Saprospiraceae bacterium]|nr:hypothetical protein [Saprospiraceae bacterium]
MYPENRSDDKGTEPETVVVGKIGSTNLLFVGLERANAVAIYDISNPINPVFLQILRTGEGPEGIVFVPAQKVPPGQNLLIVSCETEGVVNIFFCLDYKQKKYQGLLPVDISEYALSGNFKHFFSSKAELLSLLKAFLCRHAAKIFYRSQVTSF